MNNVNEVRNNVTSKQHIAIFFDKSVQTDYSNSFLLELMTSSSSSMNIQAMMH